MEQEDWRKAMLADLPAGLPEWVRRALDKVQAPARDAWFHALEDLERDLESGTNLQYNGGWEKVNERLSQSDIVTWMCTDTMVGLRVVLLDGRAVALSYQSARKNDTHFLWLTSQDAVLVREVLRTIHDAVEELSDPEVASEDPSSEWWSVQRALMRPDQPEPVIVEMVNPQGGETVKVDVQAMKSDDPADWNMLTSMRKDDFDQVNERALAGATPGERFAEYARVLGPVRAGEAYFARA